MDSSGIDYVDYTLIHFPSDRITLNDLRRVYPIEFAESPPPPPEHDFYAKSIATEHGQTLPPLPPDWLFEQLRSMSPDHAFRQLRRRHQDIFDVDQGMLDIPNNHYESSEDLSSAIFLERGLAQIAYQEAVGKPKEVGHWIELSEREGYREDLIEYYLKLGIAGKEIDGREMIDRFEAAASAQGLVDRKNPRGPRR